MASEASVRAAFRSQAEYCRKLGSPFTAHVCDALAERLHADTKIGAAVLGWQGDPAPLADGLPLRLAGALHALARSGDAPELKASYPPVMADREVLQDALDRALVMHGDRLVDFIKSPPQTNEVGRSSVLYPGLLEVASRTRTVLDLYEIGSSAGLNLSLDRYGYRFGQETAGVADSPVQLEPTWEGRAPDLSAPLVVRKRCGCDLQACNISRASERERLMAYVWPDQAERLARLQAALAIAQEYPPDVAAADAGDWVEKTFPLTGESGVTRVLMHSVTWMYLPPLTQARVTAHLQRAGEAATTDARVAWLRFEHVQTPGLVLTLWRGGAVRVLADAQPHGAWVRWHESP